VSGSETTSGLWASLPGVLDRMIAAHEQWLTALGEHKAAIGHADGVAIERALQGERAAAERVRALDDERRELIVGLTGPASADGTGPTITELARTRGASERAVLLEKAASLRGAVERVRREQSIVREASANVLGHMRGLMAHLASRLSHAGTYGSMGRVEAGPSVVSGLDIRH
jgi:hypothetical protein